LCYHVPVASHSKSQESVSRFIPGASSVLGLECLYFRPSCDGRRTSFQQNRTPWLSFRLSERIRSKTCWACRSARRIASWILRGAGPRELSPGDRVNRAGASLGCPTTRKLLSVHCITLILNTCPAQPTLTKNLPLPESDERRTASTGVPTPATGMFPMSKELIRLTRARQADLQAHLA
jgi:hypothetical protein